MIPEQPEIHGLRPYQQHLLALAEQHNVCWSRACIVELLAPTLMMMSSNIFHLPGHCGAGHR